MLSVCDRQRQKRDTEREREALACPFSGNEESFVPGKWRNKFQPYSDASLHEELDHKQMSPQPERSQMTLNQIKTHLFYPRQCVNTPHQMSAHFPFARSAPKYRGLAKKINLVFSCKSIQKSPRRNPAVKYVELQLLSYNLISLK